MAKEFACEGRANLWAFSFVAYLCFCLFVCLFVCVFVCLCVFESTQLWLGNGIFLASHTVHAADEGKVWSMSRKTASLIFTRQNFRDFMQTTFTDNSRVFVSELKKVSREAKVDMQRMFFAFTMDSIMKLFFGVKSAILQGEHDKYASAYDTAHRW